MEKQFQIGIYLAIADIRPGRNGTACRFLLPEEIAEFFRLELRYRFVEDPVVGLEADVGDESALFGTQEIAGPSDVEILHGDIETASQVGEFFDGLESPP